MTRAQLYLAGAASVGTNCYPGGRAEAPVQKKATVFVVDTHPIVRRGFQLLLNLEADLVVCGEADNGPVALEKILALKPDVVIIDLFLKSSSGLELIKQLRSLLPKVQILVFTMQAEGVYAERALRAGAKAYISKEEGTEQAIAAIRLLLRGQSYFSPQVASAMMQRLAAKARAETSAVENLTNREWEVLDMVGHGLGTREIAQKLRLSFKTIESHREHIKTKLGLKHASELVNYAFKWVNKR